MKGRRGPPEQEQIFPAAPAEAKGPPVKKEEREKYKRVTIHPRPVPTPGQMESARERARIYAWSAGIFSKVTHPRYGSVVVPHRSNYSAICCAAEVWGCDWSEILDATVTWPDPGDRKAKMPGTIRVHRERFGELT